MMNFKKSAAYSSAKSSLNWQRRKDENGQEWEELSLANFDSYEQEEGVGLSHASMLVAGLEDPKFLNSPKHPRQPDSLQNSLLHSFRSETGFLRRDENGAGKEPGSKRQKQWRPVDFRTVLSAPVGFRPSLVLFRPDSRDENLSSTTQSQRYMTDNSFKHTMSSRHAESYDLVHFDMAPKSTILHSQYMEQSRFKSAATRFCNALKIDSALLLSYPIDMPLDPENRARFLEDRLCEDVYNVQSSSFSLMHHSQNYQTGESYLDVMSSDFDPERVLNSNEKILNAILAKPFKDMRMFEFKTFSGHSDSASDSAIGKKPNSATGGSYQRRTR